MPGPVVLVCAGRSGSLSFPLSSYDEPDLSEVDGPFDSVLVLWTEDVDDERRDRRMERETLVTRTDRDGPEPDLRELEEGEDTDDSFDSIPGAPVIL
jgi:hypothetical protein